VGQSRKAAVRSRLDTLEKLFDALTSRPKAEAEQILREVRRTNDLAAAFNVDKPLVQAEESAPAAARAGMVSRPPSSANSDRMSLEGGSQFETPPSSVVTGESVSSQVSSPSRGATPASAAVSDGGGGVVRITAFPVLTSRFVQTAMPDPQTVLDAINTYYTTSGELFHIFSPDQAMRLYEMAFSTQSDVSEADRTAAFCCVSIIAAVGVTYQPSQFRLGLDQTLYNLCRHFFHELVESNSLSLNAIRVCVLLTMFNIMSKASVAVAYLAYGLSLMQRIGLLGNYEDSGLEPQEIRDYRRTWRLLMFFST
jgi:hypothetical protein